MSAITNKNKAKETKKLALMPSPKNLSWTQYLSFVKYSDLLVVSIIS